jgi:choline dehydrogenase-like flavoprotein
LWCYPGKPSSANASPADLDAAKADTFSLPLALRLSLQSPALLQLSGVGPTALLSSVGVETVIDLPGVGKNLNEVRSSILPFALSARLLTFATLSLARPANLKRHRIHPQFWCELRRERTQRHNRLPSFQPGSFPFFVAICRCRPVPAQASRRGFVNRLWSACLSSR